MFRLALAKFAKGELAPDLYGRFDVDAYQSALRKARNVMVLKHGGLTKRPGTRLVAEVYNAAQPSRLIPFQFSLTQTYALEMGHGYMRVASAGGLVLNEELAVSAITAESYARVTAAYHGYSVGDQVYFDDIDGAMGDLLNNRFWTVRSVPDQHNFVIAANTTGLAFTGSTGGITRTGAPDPDPVAPVVPPVVPDPDPPVIGGPPAWKLGYS